MPSVSAAHHYLHYHPMDLLLLDLNLNWEDGFSLLQHLLAEACDVIVASAYGKRALKAFEYGVLDFVPNPFSEEQLRRVIDRYLEGQGNEGQPLQKLTVKGWERIIFIDVSDTTNP